MELTAAEGRVLGCLIEREADDPEAVPLTLNDLRLACNQTTGRDPVVAYDDRTVEDTLLSLKSKGLARFVAPTKEVRTTRYRHRADNRWRMGPGDLAVLAVILLGGEQSVSEVRARAQALHPFARPSEVDAVLDALAARTPQPFAARVGYLPGSRETRWVEVLTGPVGSRGDGAGGPGAGGPGHGPGPVGNGLDRAVGWERPPAGWSGPTYAELVARVGDLERRLAAALDAPPPPPPPPPRPVDVRARPLPLGLPPDERRRPRTEPPATVAEVAELADRIGDIERRLARIEAELGALR
ncbi:MAG TPA: DUF480 domain-containing protein [Acidimicrobiales bacterium]|nr:DUF480 domain-containing protein [Acidimicrobiales bacterium]